jgi:hypothetical protein
LDRIRGHPTLSSAEALTHGTVGMQIGDGAGLSSFSVF